MIRTCKEGMDQDELFRVNGLSVQWSKWSQESHRFYLRGLMTKQFEY